MKYSSWPPAVYSGKKEAHSAYRAAAGAARGPQWEHWHHLPASNCGGHKISSCPWANQIYQTSFIFLCKLFWGNLNWTLQLHIMCFVRELSLLQQVYKMKNIHTDSVKKNFRLGLTAVMSERACRWSFSMWQSYANEQWCDVVTSSKKNVTWKPVLSAF